MIYTKTGDDGTTSLIGGTRVSKTHPRVEAYGTVDELNSHLGVVAELAKPLCPEAVGQIHTIQHRLFAIQTLLAAESPDIIAKLPQLTEQDSAELESWIDSLNAALPPLHSFVMAAGSLAGTQCHVARCVCRRAERRTIELAAAVDPSVLRYLNRLSDYLFVLSRKLTVAQGVEETYKKIGD